MLRPDGLLGGFVIHATAGLIESDELRAAELGPTAVSSSLPYPDLVRDAGLELTELIDVSEAFLRTIGKVLRSREKHRRALLEDFGPQACEEERERVEKLREGVQTGVLSRSLFVAANPG